MRGFTLIEIVITIALMAFLASFAVLNLAGFRTEQRLDVTANRISAALQNAQSRSLAQESNVRWGVWLDHPASGSHTYTIYQVDEGLVTGPTIPTLPAGIIEVTTLPSGVLFASPANGTSTNVMFSKGTGTPHATTTITIRRSDDASITRDITVQANGRVRY